jgi:uncharacterized protein
MLLDLNKLQGAREHVERSVPPAALGPDDPDYRVVAPVELSMDVIKVDADTFEATGRLTTRLGLFCSRCLEPFEVPVDASFELRYVPAPEAVEDSDEGLHEREIQEDDLTTAFYRDGSLDLVELMREQFQLALPMKPLCREDCRGLCPHCGANRNRTECGCAAAWEDPRLAPLKSLLNRPKEN